jgi:hypothetical protein
MKAQPTKKTWQKPELIVLVRSKPEEAVLLACKVPGNKTGPDKNSCKAAAGPGHCSDQIGS